jgi:hypothetical protein
MDVSREKGQRPEIREQRSEVGGQRAKEQMSPVKSAPVKRIRAGFTG